MTQQHPPEPWKVVEVWDAISEIKIVDKNGASIVAEETFDESTENTAYQRIVLCVNACQGISNEDLEAGVIVNRICDTQEKIRETHEAIRKVGKAIVFDPHSPSLIAMRESLNKRLRSLESELIDKVE